MGTGAQAVLMVQFGKEASQTRDYCVARNATLRAARPDPSLRKERLLKDDNQTAQLPVSITGGRRVAATTDNPQSICASPDPVCTVTSGAPPCTLPRPDLRSSRTPPCNLMGAVWATTPGPHFPRSARGAKLRRQAISLLVDSSAAPTHRRTGWYRDVRSRRHSAQVYTTNTRAAASWPNW